MGYIPVFSVGRIRIKDQVSRLQFTIADSHSFVYQAFCFACCIHSIQISNTSCSITPVNQGRTIIPSRIISSALGITTSYSIQSCLHGSISGLSGTYAFFSRTSQSHRHHFRMVHKCQASHQAALGNPLSHSSTWIRSVCGRSSASYALSIISRSVDADRCSIKISFQAYNIFSISVAKRKNAAFQSIRRVCKNQNHNILSVM